MPIDSVSDVFPDFDFDEATAQGWTRFAGRLADVLSVMDADATLRIGALPGGHGPVPYIQFVGEADGRLVAEASSNSELGEMHQLRAPQLARLEELGWDSPRADGPDAHAGFRLLGTQEASRDLADAAVAVLREVFGVTHPALLAPDQLAEILVPPPVAELPPPTSYGPAALEALVPASRADLEAAIGRELTALWGHEAVRDDAGDFAIRVGTTMVFVRASRDAQEIIVFAALVHEVEGRSRAMEVINDLNSDARYVRFMLIRDRVFASLSVFAHPFVPAHLHQALEMMSVMGDRIDSDLAAKLRGRTTFAENDPT